MWEGSLLLLQDISILVQCIEPRERWEQYFDASKRIPVELRYSDLPDSVEMFVPTPDVFVSMKLCAWIDRHAPRDLADLYKLASQGYITPESLKLAHTISGVPMTSNVIGRKITPSVVKNWETEIPHQGLTIPDAQDCFDFFIATLEKLERSE